MNDFETMENIRQQRGLPPLPVTTPAQVKLALKNYPKNIAAEGTKTESPEVIDLASGRFLNESAIRSHALRCSTHCKGGRFTRVGQDFIDEVKADVEMLVRNVRNQHSQSTMPLLEPDENTSCVTGALSDKVAVELNRLICRLIQSKVQRQPSCGKTLGRTR
jgi:hypothetical protein